MIDPTDDMLEPIEMEFDDSPRAASNLLPARPLSSFGLPARNDRSILLGNRYLSRGDIAILASTSGMGKSSLSIQAAVTWALGRPLFGGFQPNGQLKTLIFQAEDGDGDIAEVRFSIEHAMKLSASDIETVNRNVLIITDRVHRGLSFRAELQKQLAIHKPDIVIINPLLAFIGGDVNDSTDVGEFIREQLNSLNEPASFAYLIIHHTAKPPKEKSKRQWNEVMYEMAGSADLTNSARAIMALQPGETEGEFCLKLAKRGTRAGCTVLKEGAAGVKFPTPVTEVHIRHSNERMEVNGQNLAVIHWEQFEPTPKEDHGEHKSGGGRKRKYKVSDFEAIFPKGLPRAKGFRALHNEAKEIKPSVGTSAFEGILEEACDLGLLLVDKANPRQPKYYAL